MDYSKYFAQLELDGAYPMRPGINQKNRQNNSKYLAWPNHPKMNRSHD